MRRDLYDRWMCMFSRQALIYHMLFYRCKCICIDIYIHITMCIYIYIYILHTHIHIHIIHVYIYDIIYTYIYMIIYIYTILYIYIYHCIWIQAIFTHTIIHMYVYVYPCMDLHHLRNYRRLLGDLHWPYSTDFDDFARSWWKGAGLICLRREERRGMGKP